MIKIAPRLDPRIYILKSYCSKAENIPLSQVTINEDELTLRLQCMHMHPTGWSKASRESLTAGRESLTAIVHIL